MKVGKGYAGFESLFIIGVLAAAYASLTITQLYSTAPAVLLTNMMLLYFLSITGSHSINKASQIIMPAAALAAGIFCGINGRLTSYATGGAHHLTEVFHPVGQALQTAIDSIPFKDRDTNALLKALSICGFNIIGNIYYRIKKCHIRTSCCMISKRLTYSFSCEFGVFILCQKLCGFRMQKLW